VDTSRVRVRVRVVLYVRLPLISRGWISLDLFLVIRDIIISQLFVWLFFCQVLFCPRPFCKPDPRFPRLNLLGRVALKMAFLKVTEAGRGGLASSSFAAFLVLFAP